MATPPSGQSSPRRGGNRSPTRGRPRGARGGNSQTPSPDDSPDRQQGSPRRGGQPGQRRRPTRPAPLAGFAQPEDPRQGYGTQQRAAYELPQPTPYGTQQRAPYELPQPIPFGAQQSMPYAAQQPTAYGAQPPTTQERPSSMQPILHVAQAPMLNGTQPSMTHAAQQPLPYDSQSPRAYEAQQLPYGDQWRTPHEGHSPIAGGLRQIPAPPGGAFASRYIPGGMGGSPQRSPRGLNKPGILSQNPGAKSSPKRSPGRGLRRRGIPGYFFPDTESPGLGSPGPASPRPETKVPEETVFDESAEVRYEHFIPQGPVPWGVQVPEEHAESDPEFAGPEAERLRRAHELDKHLAGAAAAFSVRERNPPEVAPPPPRPSEGNEDALQAHVEQIMQESRQRMLAREIRASQAGGGSTWAPVVPAAYTPMAGDISPPAHVYSGNELRLTANSTIERRAAYAWSDAINTEINRLRNSSLTENLRRFIGKRRAYIPVHHESKMPLNSSLLHLVIPPIPWRYVQPAVLNVGHYVYRVLQDQNYSSVSKYMKERREQKRRKREGEADSPLVKMVVYPLNNFPTVAGFENALTREWYIPIIALLYYTIIPTRLCIGAHTCTNANCWICELLYIFDHLDGVTAEQSGKPVSVINLADCIKSVDGYKGQERAVQTHPLGYVASGDRKPMVDPPPILEHGAMTRRICRNYYPRVQPDHWLFPKAPSKKGAPFGRAERRPPSDPIQALLARSLGLHQSFHRALTLILHSFVTKSMVAKNTPFNMKLLPGVLDGLRGDAMRDVVRHPAVGAMLREMKKILEAVHGKPRVPQTFPKQLDTLTFSSDQTTGGGTRDVMRDACLFRGHTTVTCSTTGSVRCVNLETTCAELDYKPWLDILKKNQANIVAINEAPETPETPAFVCETLSDGGGVSEASDSSALRSKGDSLRAVLGRDRTRTKNKTRRSRSPTGSQRPAPPVDVSGSSSSSSATGSFETPLGQHDPPPGLKLTDLIQATLKKGSIRMMTCGGECTGVLTQHTLTAQVHTIPLCMLFRALSSYDGIAAENQLLWWRSGGVIADGFRCPFLKDVSIVPGYGAPRIDYQERYEKLISMWLRRHKEHLAHIPTLLEREEFLALSEYLIKMSSRKQLPKRYVVQRDEMKEWKVTEVDIELEENPPPPIPRGRKVCDCSNPDCNEPHRRCTCVNPTCTRPHSLCHCLSTTCPRPHQYELANVVASVNYRWTPEMKKSGYSIWQQFLAPGLGLDKHYKKASKFPDVSKNVKDVYMADTEGIDQIFEMMDVDEASGEAPCPEGHLISYVKVPADGPALAPPLLAYSARDGYRDVFDRSCSRGDSNVKPWSLEPQYQWVMINGPVVTAVSEDEVLSCFACPWLLPVTFCYTRSSALRNWQALRGYTLERKPMDVKAHLLDSMYDDINLYRTHDQRIIELHHKESEAITAGEFCFAMDIENVVQKNIDRAPDCIFPPAEIPAIGRVSMVRANADPMDFEAFFDRYVQFDKPPTDLKTEYSGLHVADLNVATSKKWLVPAGLVRKIMHYCIMRGNRIVGHDLFNDMRALGLYLPPWQLLDTVDIYRLEDADEPKKLLGLRFLIWAIFGTKAVQQSHDSVEDAVFSLMLYRFYQAYLTYGSEDSARFDEDIMDPLMQLGKIYGFKVPAKELDDDEVSRLSQPREIRVGGPTSGVVLPPGVSLSDPLIYRVWEFVNSCRLQNPRLYPLMNIAIVNSIPLPEMEERIRKLKRMGAGLFIPLLTRPVQTLQERVKEVSPALGTHDVWGLLDPHSRVLRLLELLALDKPYRYTYPAMPTHPVYAPVHAALNDQHNQ